MLKFLLFVVFLFVALFFGLLKIIGLVKYSYLQRILKKFFVCLYFLLFFISIKLFLFDIYKIPSSSMESMLYPGDIIMVNKFKYGAKLPRSPFEIPILKLPFLMNKNASLRRFENWWPYKRLQGSASIRQGDVFVFSLDNSIDYFVVKRCVGLPGDTLMINKGEIYSNSKHYNSPETVKNNCRFLIKNKRKLLLVKDSLELPAFSDNYSKNQNIGQAAFSIKEFNVLQQMQCIDSIKKIIDTYDSSGSDLLRTTTSKWSLDQMGPLVIPQKGMEILLDSDNVMLYGKILELFEKVIAIKKNGSYFINGKRATTYKFKLDYYFMMGDNRKETMDSRTWGFLPESNIIGKVQCVVVSNHNNEFHWNRFLKIL